MNFLNQSKIETDAMLLKKLILADIKEKYEVRQSSSGSTAVSYEADEDDIYSYYEE